MLTSEQKYMTQNQQNLIIRTMHRNHNIIIIINYVRNKIPCNHICRNQHITYTYEMLHPNNPNLGIQIILLILPMFYYSTSVKKQYKMLIIVLQA